MCGPLYAHSIEVVEMGDTRIDSQSLIDTLFGYLYWETYRNGFVRKKQEFYEINYF